MRQIVRVAIGLGLILWLCGVAPAPARSQDLGPPDPADPCIGGGRNGGDVPFCSSAQRFYSQLGGWETDAVDFTCSDPNYPYYWGNNYTQNGSPSISVSGVITFESPGTFQALVTNWNPFAADDLIVRIACSKSNSFGGDCGGPVSDPGCPEVPGSTQNHCSGGPVPVCILTYQERCQPGNQLYQCTNTLGIAYCQQCPG
jgi:hypothetical protein